MRSLPRTRNGRASVAMLAAVLAPILSGCGQLFYSKIDPGEFKGRLVVEWVQPNEFIYSPDPAFPLRFRTPDDRVIEPRRMYTDGGSIPRLFWSYPGLGPWDFGPGYIVHDWLFEQHHCKLGDWEQISFDDSATILGEALKTQMEKAPPELRDPELVWAIYEAVRSPIARDLWVNGKCGPQPPPANALLAPGASAPVTIRVFSFGAAP